MRQMKENDWLRMSVLAGLSLAGIVLSACSDRPIDPLSPVRQRDAHPRSEVTSAPGSWVTMAAMPTARQGAIAGVIDGKLYVAGGSGGTASDYYPYPRFRVLEVYDPATDTWTSKAPMPIGVNGGAAVGVIDGKLYVAGGSASADEGNEQATVQMYDPATDTWAFKAPMPVANSGMAFGVIDGKLYVTGGSRNDNDRALRVYDPVTDTWGEKSPIPDGIVAGMAAGVIGGKLYVTGGSGDPCFSSGCTIIGTLRIYDPSTDTWDVTKAPMPTPLSMHSVGVLNGRLHVIGGVTGCGNCGIGQTIHQVYDPGTDSWTIDSPLPTGRQSLVAGVIDGRLYATGGVSGPSYYESWKNALEVFTPASAGKADQAITFGTLSNRTFGDTPFSLSATASSGLSVSFTASGSCAVVGSTVLITSVGTCTVTANQAGNEFFNPAPSVQQDFAVFYSAAVGHRFLQPINTPPQAQSVFKAGSTIPVKFQLFLADGVTPVTTAVATIQVTQVFNGVPNGTPVEVVSTVPNAWTTFRYDATAQQYIFNLGTKSWTAGSYQITARLDDGSQITVIVGAR